MEGHQIIPWVQRDDMEVPQGKMDISAWDNGTDEGTEAWISFNHHQRTGCFVQQEAAHMGSG